MPAPRTVLAAGAVTVAVAVLAGCDKPTPQVTVQSGNKVVTTEARRYQRDGKVQTFQRSVPSLPVHEGDRVAIDVPASLAENGWIVAVDGTQLTPIEKGHFASVTITSLGAIGVAELRVERVGSRTANGGFVSSGEWVVQLVRRS